jgi:hypothetical protein
MRSRRGMSDLMDFSDVVCPGRVSCRGWCKRRENGRKGQDGGRVDGSTYHFGDGREIVTAGGWLVWGVWIEGLWMPFVDVVRAFGGSWVFF